MNESIESRDDRTDQAAPAERSAAILGELISLMGFEATVRPDDQQGGHWLVVESPEASRLIGRDGQTLEALQLLLHRMARRGNARTPSFTLDVGDYRRRQLSQLRLAAKDAADVVRHRGRPITLDPMASPERRIIHETLRDDPDVETVSTQPRRGGLKSVEIRPVRDEPAAGDEGGPEDAG